MPENILVSDLDAGVCTITLNRPDKKNALSIALRDELTSALQDIAANPEAKVVIITGAGDVFSAGFDLKEFQHAAGDPAFHATLWASSDRYHHTCLFYPLPVVAAVNGPAIAGGCDLATMCDLRVAAEHVYFSHPEISFGDVMYSPLHDLVGGALARELCLTGRKIYAKEAADRGLVSQVVPPTELPAAARELAATIASGPREVLLRTKAKIINRTGIVPGGTLTL